MDEFEVLINLFIMADESQAVIEFFGFNDKFCDCPSVWLVSEKKGFGVGVSSELNELDVIQGLLLQ